MENRYLEIFDFFIFTRFRSKSICSFHMLPVTQKCQKTLISAVGLENGKITDIELMLQIDSPLYGDKTFFSVFRNFIWVPGKPVPQNF